MADKNTVDSSTDAKRPLSPAEIDALGFFPTLKAGIVVPVKTSLKLASVTLTLADSAASAIYDNKEEISKISSQALRQTINAAKAGVIAMAKLNKELGDALKFNMNEDIDTIINGIYYPEE